MKKIYNVEASSLFRLYTKYTVKGEISFGELSDYGKFGDIRENFSLLKYSQICFFFLNSY